MNKDRALIQARSRSNVDLIDFVLSDSPELLSDLLTDAYPDASAFYFINPKALGMNRHRSGQ
jgi:hypothetical protein